MAVAYLNGGGPLYPGVSFTNQTEFCTLIRDLLTSLNWTVVSGTPSNLPIVFKSAREVDGVYVYLHFDYVIEYGYPHIHIRGSTDGISANLSPAPAAAGSYNGVAPTPIHFTMSGDNRLWAVADEDTLVIYVRRSIDSWRTCAYYGRLDIEVANPLDGWAWGIFDMTIFRASDRFNGLLVRSHFPGFFARRFASSVYWQTIPGNNITRTEWTGYNFLPELNLSHSARVAPQDVGLNMFDAVQNYKVPIVPFWRCEEHGHFRGIFKFVVRGLYGATLDSIHPRYIPEANKIAYYISFTTGSNGTELEGVNLGAGIGGMLIAES
jgi:hypothetical protein